MAYTMAIKEPKDMEYSHSGKNGLPIAWFGRGNALRKLQRYKEAILSYNKALELQPDFHARLPSQSSLLCITRQS